MQGGVGEVQTNRLRCHLPLRLHRRFHLRRCYFPRLRLRLPRLRPLRLHPRFLGPRLHPQGE